MPKCPKFLSFNPNIQSSMKYQKEKIVSSRKNSLQSRNFILETGDGFSRENNFSRDVWIFTIFEKKYPHFSTPLRLRRKTTQHCQNRDLTQDQVNCFFFFYKAKVWSCTKVWQFELSTIFHCPWFNYTVHSNYVLMKFRNVLYEYNVDKNVLVMNSLFSSDLINLPPSDNDLTYYNMACILVKYIDI